MKMVVAELRSGSLKIAHLEQGVDLVMQRIECGDFYRILVQIKMEDRIDGAPGPLVAKQSWDAFSRCINETNDETLAATDGPLPENVRDLVLAYYAAYTGLQPTLQTPLEQAAQGSVKLHPQERVYLLEPTGHYAIWNHLIENFAKKSPVMGIESRLFLTTDQSQQLSIFIESSDNSYNVRMSASLEGGDVWGPSLPMVYSKDAFDDPKQRAGLLLYQATLALTAACREKVDKRLQAGSQ
jgi:hypothetical protein